MNKTGSEIREPDMPEYQSTGIFLVGQLNIDGHMIGPTFWIPDISVQ